MGKEEAERGVGRGEKERGWRIARLNHYSERKAKGRDQRRRRVVSLISSRGSTGEAGWAMHIWWGYTSHASF